MTAKEQQSEWYKSINPSGKVPALLVNDKEVDIIYFSIAKIVFLNEIFQMVVESLVINEYLCEAIMPTALPADLLERANIRRWICYISDNIVPFLFMIVNQKREGKDSEAESTLRKLQENWSLLVENSKLKKGSRFLFGEQLSLADFAGTSFLQHQTIVLGHFFKGGLYEYEGNAPVQENLIHLKQYLKNIKDDTRWCSLTYNIQSLPPLEKAPKLVELGMDNLEKFDYEKLLIYVYSSDFKK